MIQLECQWKAQSISEALLFEFFKYFNVNIANYWIIITIIFLLSLKDITLQFSISLFFNLKKKKKLQIYSFRIIKRSCLFFKFFNDEFSCFLKRRCDWCSYWRWFFNELDKYVASYKLLWNEVRKFVLNKTNISSSVQQFVFDNDFEVASDKIRG